jgi:hypothetical protein
MKADLFNSIRHSGRKWSFILSLIGLLLGGNAAQATDALASFSGSIGPIPPNIDATNFYNAATWNIIVSPKPFQTANTLTYSNISTMSSSIGWEFDYGPNNSGSLATRSWSSKFFNDTLGIISATSGIGNSGTQLQPVGYLLVSATNIVNKGILSADTDSEIVLTGSTVDVHRSAIEIVPSALTLAGSLNSSNGFTADFGVSDEYWAQGTLNKMNSSTIWNGTTAVSPLSNVAEPCTTGTLPVQIASFIPTLSDSTNYITPGGTIDLTVTNVFATTNVYGPNNLFATNFFGTNIVLGTTNFFGTNIILGMTNFFGTNIVFGATNILGTNIVFETTNLFGTNITVSNVSLATNTIRQAVFVNILDPNITAQVHFSPSTAPTNFFQTVAVQIASPFTNILSPFTLQTNLLYLVDTLASGTNHGLLTNLMFNPYADCSGATFRPANYILSRRDPGDFALGQSGAGQPAADFLHQADFTNNVVNGAFAAYSALVDNQAFQLGTAYSITNLPGRVQIKADNLNLNQTTIVADGEVKIQASNIVSSVGAVVDCPNLSFNLGGATTGNLTVTNLAMASLRHYQGTVSCWSAVWTNTETVVTPNYTVTSNAPPVFSPLTNSVTVALYALLVDASALSSQTPVIVQDLALHSTNMVVGDSMNVASTLLFDGQSLTLDGNLTLFSLIQNWTYVLAPKLRYFTNNALLDIAADAHFGDDGPTNYLAFVNNGTIFSADQTINADNLQINSGAINETSLGDFSGITKTGQLSGALIFSALDIRFTAQSLQINQTVLEAFNALDFTVTGSLSDNGFGSGNLFVCENGFNLFAKPTTGDLLGTTIITAASYGGAEVDNSWAGSNRGVSVAGYKNNVAIGKLTLSPQGNTNAFEPLFAFFGTAGTTDGNGMYVSNLDLSLLTDYANEIYIDPSLDIYYVTASLNGTNGAAQFLDGKFNGHLHWVQSGVTLTPHKISGNAVPGGKFQINPPADPDLTNIIEASTNLVNWIPIYTNVGPAPFIDLQATNYPYRFYRTHTLPPP